MASLDIDRMSETFEVKVCLGKNFRLRCWIGIKLLALAIWIMPIDCAREALDGWDM